jgi:hypothetical protein
VRLLGNILAARAALPTAVCVLALAGCSNGPDPVPAACSGTSATVLAALRRAPGAVTLADGTPLSRCVRLARTDSDLQSLGFVLTRAGDALHARANADPAAALQLGYLVGAVRSGAAASSIASQLARHVAQLASLAPGPRAAETGAALQRGLRAGGRSG